MDIKVTLYEDNQNLRNALTVLIGGTDGFELVGAFENCLNIVRQTEVLKPDVILMDIDLPEMSGIEGVALLKKDFPNAEVLMITVFDDDDRVFQAICAGASGYLLKKTDPAKILDAIKEVSLGGAPMSPVIARKVLKYYAQKNTQQEEARSKLTERELEVLNLLSKGFSHKMAANELAISIDTIRTHIKRIYQKLQVHSITEAIAKTHLK